MDWIETGMPGIKRDPGTLLPVIVDEELADGLLAGDDPCDAVVVLIVRGEHHAAAELVAETRLKEPQNIRMRMLDADLVRATGHHERSIRRLRSLLEEFAGTSHEAMLNQYLGILYYTTGDFKAAVARFRAALELHTAAGALPRRVELACRSLEAAEGRLAAVR
ncbi:tetratricopeptide repeat protein [Zafaria sp. J156]|uniref:tetratricopeptide repeat protein n=1 Tax=Zafaria sp. J156 TaxID=3116490 RepID=UPI002E79C36B|nr:tetratricopeptide repeat protein [Zafaria sp. J156]MEE1621124.1 tetratricopeptide repeat protein [Zafaria sp. J156]